MHGIPQMLLVVLLLTVLNNVDLGECRPQFFSRRPTFSYDRNENTLNLPFNVRVKNPFSPSVPFFGSSKRQPEPAFKSRSSIPADNIERPETTQPPKTTLTSENNKVDDHILDKVFNPNGDRKELKDKVNGEINTADNEIDNFDTTTELSTETTTDDQTTPFDDSDLANRSGVAPYVATLLG